MIALCLMAQGSGFDMQVFSDPDISGSARYVGMAGAMTAVGGDASAVKDNPAALGIFRHSEITLSVDVQPNGYRTDNMVYRAAVSLPEVAWTICRTHPDRRSGLLSSAFHFAYHRARNYTYEGDFSGLNLPYSQTDVMADMSNGLPYSALKDEQAYDNPDIGWLSKAGFDTWLIDTIGNTNNWQSLEPGTVDLNLHVREVGHLDDYQLAWGMNISYKFNLGIGVRLRSLTYSKETSHLEHFESGNRYALDSRMTASGLGAGLQVGMIGRPISWLRVAASFESPIWSQITYGSHSNIESALYLDGKLEKFRSQPSSSFTQAEKLSFPLRSTVGAAFIFSTNGLLSLEYDYQHQTKSWTDAAHILGSRDVHVIKIGGEWVLRKNFFLQMGYGLMLYGPYAKNAQGERVECYIPDLNTTRTDTDFRHLRPRQYASIGFEHKTDYWVFGGAYQFYYQQTDWYAHAYQMSSEQPEPFTGKTFGNKIVFTLAWRYR